MNGRPGKGGAGGVPHAPGASDETLARRAAYGGRKGRRAKKRLDKRTIDGTGKPGGNGYLVLWTWTDAPNGGKADE